MESIKVYIRVKPSYEKATKLFDVVTNTNNYCTLLNLKTGENFSYGKKFYLILNNYNI